MTEDARPLEPWDRRANESDPAWEAFVLYRDSGASRSQTNVAKALGKTRQLLSGWSAQHDWVDRAAAWDLEQDRQRREAMRQENVEAGRRHARQAGAFLSTATMFPAELMRRVQENPALLQTMPLEELMDNLAKLGRTVPRLVVAERLARGMTTESVEQRGAMDTFREQVEGMSDERLEGFLLGAVAGAAAAGDASPEDLVDEGQVGNEEEVHDG